MCEKIITCCTSIILFINRRFNPSRSVELRYAARNLHNDRLHESGRDHTVFSVSGERVSVLWPPSAGGARQQHRVAGVAGPDHVTDVGRVDRVRSGRFRAAAASVA